MCVCVGMYVNSSGKRSKRVLAVGAIILVNFVLTPPNGS